MFDLVKCSLKYNYFLHRWLGKSNDNKFLSLNKSSFVLGVRFWLALLEYTGIKRWKNDREWNDENKSKKSNNINYYY